MAKHPGSDAAQAPGTIYRIRLKGQLGPQWVDWFDGLTITHEAEGETLLTGPLADQAALHGVFKRVRDLGMPLLAVDVCRSDMVTQHQRAARQTAMEDVQIRLSVLWIATMLTYLLGDVLRIFAGDFKPGQISDVAATQGMWLGIAALMVIPIVMVVLAVTLPQPVSRWVNIVAAIFFFGFNLIGLPSYPTGYDRFLIVVGLAFNVVTVWYAWQWK